MIDYLIERGFTLVKCSGKRPIEKDWPSLTPRPKEHFENHKGNIGVVCGKALEGGYLVVLDFDKKHGAYEYQFKHPLPITLTTTTSGGEHFYFLSRSPIKKTKLGKGIDVQGVGCQVLAPPSIHPETKKPYVFQDPDMVIEWLPEWLEEDLNKPLPLAGAIDDGSRDVSLTRIAGAFRREGCDEKEIFEKLKMINETECNPPLSELQVAKIAKSIQRYSPEITPSYVEKTKVKLNDSIEDFLKSDSFDFYENSSGIINKLLLQSRSCADRPFDDWNLAASLAIVSAAAQGSYYFPDSFRTSLNLYQWLAGPSGCGKNFYKSFVEKYCRKIHEHIVAPKFGSAYGLRASLYSFNSRISVIDEMQDELARLSSSKGSYLYQILTDMKELFNSGDVHAETVIKDRVYKSIKNPRYSVFCLSVRQGIRSLLTKEHIGGGLASRFLFYPTDTIQNHTGGNIFEIDQNVMQILLKIFYAGKSEFFDNNDQEGLMALYGGTGVGAKAKSAPDHLPQLVPSVAMSLTPEAWEMFSRYQDAVKTLYRDVYNANIDDDASPAPSIERSAMYVKKLSSLHALGCDRTTIYPEDMVFGIGASKRITSHFVRFMQLNTSVSIADESQNALLRLIKKKETVSYRDLLNNTKLSKMVVRNTICELAEMGKIICLKDGQEVLELNPNKWPRGLVFTWNK